MSSKRTLPNKADCGLYIVMRFGDGPAPFASGAGRALVAVLECVCGCAQTQTSATDRTRPGRQADCFRHLSHFWTPFGPPRINMIRKCSYEVRQNKGVGSSPW